MLIHFYKYQIWIIKHKWKSYPIPEYKKKEGILKFFQKKFNYYDISLNSKTNDQFYINAWFRDLSKAEGFETEEGTLSRRILFVQGSGLLETESYRKGLFSVQDQASCLTAEKLAPKPGDTVLDICAAPGGKSLAMAEIMENRGRIRAFDIYEHKLALLNREAERLGLSVIETEENDGTKEKTELLASADCVLVDGPCSGLGVLRRKPEIKYREISDEGRSFAEKQLQILNISSAYVKQGGRLLYSTCTINANENSRVAERFLEEHKEFVPEEQIQLLPDDTETDGFFICAMRKTDC